MKKNDLQLAGYVVLFFMTGHAMAYHEDPSAYLVGLVLLAMFAAR